jgi:transposase
MPILHPIPDDVVLVAIDIAKARNEVLIDIPGHKHRRRLTVLNTRADHDRLLALLTELGRPIACGIEATGNYHRPIAWRLRGAGCEVRLVSSVALARTREALHNGWDKNDPKDAQVILHMLRIGATQLYHDPLAAGINDIQELSKTHEAISIAKTQVLHRIVTHYLPLYFPEIERFRQNSRSDWFFAFLDMFPTPASITAMDKQAFVAAAWSVIGRKVSKERLLGDIYETARSSIGLPVPVDAPAIRMFRLVIAEARSLIRQRNEIEALADQLLAESQITSGSAAFRASDRSTRSRSWPRPAISAASAIIASSSNSAGSTCQPTSQERSGDRQSFPSLVMPGSAAPSGWQPRSLSDSVRTVSATSSSATSRAIGTTRI